MNGTSIEGVSLRSNLARFPAGLYILVGLSILLGLLQPRFFGVDNLLNIFRNASILALASFGQAIVVVTGGIDLSMGSLVALVSVAMILTGFHASITVAFFAGLVVALAVGAVNGALVARFDLQPFLATLGMLTMLQGLASLLVGGLPVEAPTSGFRILGSGDLWGVPISILMAIVGYVIFQLLMTRTTLGRAWYLVGSSVAAARSAGLRVDLYRFLAYVAAAGFAGAAGLILASRVNSAQPHLEPTLPFDAIAACAIGGIPLRGGVGWPYQVCIGALVLAVIDNGLQLLNLPSNIHLALIGVLMIGALGLQRLTQGDGGGR